MLTYSGVFSLAKRIDLSIATTFLGEMQITRRWIIVCVCRKHVFTFLKYQSSNKTVKYITYKVRYYRFTKLSISSTWINIDICSSIVYIVYMCVSVNIKTYSIQPSYGMAKQYMLKQRGSFLDWFISSADSVIYEVCCAKSSSPFY